MELPLAWETVFFSDFFMGTWIAMKFDRLYPRIKQEASKTMTPVSVFAYYDPYSRRWIYTITTKLKYFHQPFYVSLKQSFLLMRKHAEKLGVSNIRLPEKGCRIDQLQLRTVSKVPTEVFDRTNVSVTVFTKPPPPLPARMEFLDMVNNLSIASIGNNYYMSG